MTDAPTALHSAAIRPQSILFVGTRTLSVRCLRFLVETVGRERILGVLTLPKNERGWWSRCEEGPELWEAAETLDLPLLDESALTSSNYDLLLSVLWERIFPPAVLQRPRHGAINLHPAPLPDMRGSATRSQAILSGRTSYGVSLHYMVQRVDEGDLLGVSRFPILPSDTAADLDLRTMQYGYPLFCETWLRLQDGSAVRRPQAEVASRLGIQPQCYKVNSIDTYLQLPETSLSDSEIDRRMRALTFPPKLSPPLWLTTLSKEKARDSHP